MRAVLSCVVVVAMAATFALVNADDKQAAKSPGKATPFDKFKALTGEWVITKGPAEHGHEGGTITYKQTAGGSAVMETMFGGGDHEMITLYYMDGGNMALTHYCVLQNRPMMRAEPQSSPDKITFKCLEKDNPKLDAEDHMHQATYTFVDADHLKSEWVLHKGGKPESTHSFELARKKK